MVNQTRGLRVTHCWEIPKEDERAFYCWLPDVTYRKLTTDKRSIQRDEAICETVKAVGHAVAIWQRPVGK